jgi:hypothetical protein
MKRVSELAAIHKQRKEQLKLFRPKTGNFTQTIKGHRNADGGSKTPAGRRLLQTGMGLSTSFLQSP